MSTRTPRPPIDVAEEGLDELIGLVDDQLKCTPPDRVRLLLGRSWPRCEAGLRAAAALGDGAALVGPVAIALLGGPNRPGDGRVDVLCDPDAHLDLVETLIAQGARSRLWRAGSDARSERREHWTLPGGGELTLRSRATGIDAAAVVARAQPIDIAGDAHALVATLEDLVAIVAVSPWSEEQPLRAGLRATVAWRQQHAAPA